MRLEASGVLGEQPAGSRRDLKDTWTLNVGQRLAQPPAPEGEHFDRQVVGAGEARILAIKALAEGALVLWLGRVSRARIAHT